MPHLRAQGYGRFIAITSQVLDGAPTPRWTAYAVAKGGLATLILSSKIRAGFRGCAFADLASISPSVIPEPPQAAPSLGRTFAECQGKELRAFAQGTSAAGS